MPETQNFKNHVRRDPPFLVVALILFLNVLVTIFVCISSALHHGTHHLAIHLWLIVVSIALLIVAVERRTKDIKVQDRVIRLEERVRYAAVLPPAAVAASASLTPRQIVALRFASDAELPTLIARTVTENLEPKQIKESIITWRPDDHRV